MANTPTVQELVQAGKQSQEKGDLAHALSCYTLATQLNPADETIWLLRSEVTSDSAEAAYCLDQVLKLNPDNVVAKDRILVKRVGSLQQEARQRTEAMPARRESAIARLRARVRWPVLVVALILVVCAVGVVGIGVVGFIANSNSRVNAENVALISTPTLSVLALPATWTPAPTRTETPMPRRSPTPAPVYRALLALTVRTGPGTSYPTLGTLAQGTTLVVTGKSVDSKYLQIDYGSGRLGWVPTDSVVIGGADLARLPAVPVAPLAAAPKAVPTLKPAPVPVLRPTAIPAIHLDFALGRPPELVGDCSRPWRVLGTVYDARNTAQRVNGVLIRIWASNQLQGTIASGSYAWNMPGYWEWRLGSNSDVSGEIAVVNSDGTRRSDFVSFHLTSYCSGAGAVNQVVIDMVGNP